MKLLLIAVLTLSFSSYGFSSIAAPKQPAHNLKLTEITKVICDVEDLGLLELININAPDNFSNQMLLDGKSQPLTKNGMTFSLQKRYSIDSDGNKETRMYVDFSLSTNNGFYFVGNVGTLKKSIVSYSDLSQQEHVGDGSLSRVNHNNKSTTPVDIYVLNQCKLSVNTILN